MDNEVELLKKMDIEKSTPAHDEHGDTMRTEPLRLTDLPPEVLEKVLDQLSLRDLRAIWQTCQYLRRIALCPALRAWR